MMQTKSQKAEISNTSGAPGLSGPSRLRIASAERDGAILVCDDDNNDVAEFFHNEHATVSQSFETALAYARALVNSVSEDRS